MVFAMVFGAVILLTWMVVHSYRRPEAHLIRRRARPAHGGRHDDAGWVFSSSDGSASHGSGSDCGAADAGGSCGDAGGGGDGGGD
jgi:hypothetical protein